MHTGTLTTCLGTMLLTCCYGALGVLIGGTDRVVTARCVVGQQRAMLPAFSHPGIAVSCAQLRAALLCCCRLQALVEHFAGLNQPGRVEACVVHLPIMSMDLNQVRQQAHRGNGVLGWGCAASDCGL